jgi:hypothetical protein
VVTGVGSTQISAAGSNGANPAAVLAEGAMATAIRANMALPSSISRRWRTAPGRVSSRNSRGDQPSSRRRAHQAAPTGTSANRSA